MAYHKPWGLLGSRNRFSRPLATDGKTAEPRVVFLCNQAYDKDIIAGRGRSLDHTRVII